MKVTKEMATNVFHPSHYEQERIPVTIYLEPIDLCELYGFNVGNAIKYLLRAKNKGAYLQDLMKAHWYITREELLFVRYSYLGERNCPNYNAPVYAIFKSYREHNQFIANLINDCGEYTTESLRETANLIIETINENERADDTRLFDEGD